MSIVIGDKKIKDINVSNKNVQKIVDIITGGIIFEKDKPISSEYFFIENTYDGSNTITIKTIKKLDTTDSYATQLQYSKDKDNWTTITLTGTNTIPMKIGERVYFRNDNGFFNCYDLYTHIKCSYSHKVGGNIKSLLNFTDNDVAYTPYCFYELFYSNSTLIDANQLIIPNSKLAEYCLNKMFYGCTSLIQAPSLPATNLEKYCYSDMFTNCTSLEKSPSLPATNLKFGCYYNMFYGCTSLIQAPSLPATKLANNCYQQMFRNCKVLTTTPILPSTTLEIACYGQMFQGCTSLVNVSSLPATNLANNCYNGMFRDCTSLVNAPILPAENLVQECYYYMFYNCSSLNNVTSYANDISASNCTENWLSGVSSTGTFYNYGSAKYVDDSVSGIPPGWIVVKN